MKLFKSLFIAIGIVTLLFSVVIGGVLILNFFGIVAFLLAEALALVMAYTILFYYLQ